LPDGLTHAFPAAETLATAHLDENILPPPIAWTIQHFASAVAAGNIRLDGSLGLDTFTARMTSIPGIDPTTAHHLAMRLGERDAFPSSDPSVLNALRAIDLGEERADRTAQSWRPWRSLAATHLLAHHELTQSTSSLGPAIRQA
jgi:3-methyladenine DNA glycosylase/8-oxoguanine DNA glycosylase